MSQCTCLPYQDGGPCSDCQKTRKIHDLQNELMVRRAALEVAVDELEAIQYIANSMATCPPHKRTPKAPIITLETIAETAAYALKVIRKIRIDANAKV